MVRKLAQTFVDSEVMKTTIEQFIRKLVDDAITDAVDHRTATMLAKKMRIDDKTTAYRTGNRADEPPLDIVILDEDSSS